MFESLKLFKMIEIFFVFLGGAGLQNSKCLNMSKLSGRPGGPNVNILHMFNSSDLAPPPKKHMSNIQNIQKPLNILNVFKMFKVL